MHEDAGRALEAAAAKFMPRDYNSNSDHDCDCWLSSLFSFCPGVGSVQGLCLVCFFYVEGFTLVCLLGGLSTSFYLFPGPGR
jgi:hypothetical protein